VCADTACRPLLEPTAPCSLCSRHPQRGWGEGVLLLWWVNSRTRLPRACCPSNCCVVTRRVPQKALSDSSKSLASNSDVDPLSANNSPSRPPWGTASRRGLVLVCVQSRRLLALSPGLEHLPGEGTQGPGKVKGWWDSQGEKESLTAACVSAGISARRLIVI